jgi:hypothetical protein
MILLVQFLWGWKWEVELTSCENVLTYFITKDAKLCKSFYSPSLYFFFYSTHYVYFQVSGLVTRLRLVTNPVCDIHGQDIEA